LLNLIFKKIISNSDFKSEHTLLV